MSELLEYLVENEPSFRKARLPALYSDFRSQRALNPDGYQANVSAWSRGLAAIARSGLAPSSSENGAPSDSLVLDCDDRLLGALESKRYGRPLGLGAVVAEALAGRDLVSLQDFLHARESVYHRSRGLSAWSIATWIFRQLGVTDALAGSDTVPQGRFVVLANVEAAAKAFSADAASLSSSSRFERTFSKAHFHRTFADRLVTGRTLSETDMDVFLTFLSRDRGVVLYDGATVKIRTTTTGRGETSSAGLTEEDASIAQLRELLDYLGRQAAALERRVEELGRTARAAVAEGSRTAALTALRSKKLAETSLGQRLAAAGQLEEVAARIEQAADNVQLVRVMESSGEALRSLNAATGGAARVEDVVGRLRNQMGEADEVTSILAEGASGAGAVVDEAEIDLELAELEGQEKRKDEERERENENEKERARKQEAAEQQEKEAEETRKRLEAIEAPKGSVPTTGEKQQQQESSPTRKEALVEGATESLSRMSLNQSSPEARLSS